MRRFYRMTFRLIAIASVLAGLTAFEDGGPPELGQQAPELRVNTFDGPVFDLADMRGRVVLVNFWATWCGPCLEEMPALNAFFLKYHAQGLEMIALSIDSPKDLSKARRLAGRLSYPGALASASASNGFGIPEAVPVTYVIDKRGMVRDRFIAVDDELLRDAVLPLLHSGELQPVAAGR